MTYEIFLGVSGPRSFSHTKYLTHRWNLLKLINDLPRNSPILEIGPGQGELMQVCVDAGFTNITGVDIDWHSVEAIRSRGFKAIELSELLGFFDDTSDKWSVIFMIDVLEHIPKEQMPALVTAMRQHLTPSGRYIVQVPNMQSLFPILNFYHSITHEYSFTESSLRQLLRNSGFSNVQFFPQDYPLMIPTYLVRHILRQVLYTLLRIILLIDQPNRGRILTPNLIAVAH